MSTLLAYATLAFVTYAVAWRLDTNASAECEMDTSEAFCLLCGVAWPLFWPLYAWATVKVTADINRKEKK